MSTLPGRDGAALLVIDVQVDVMATACRRDEVIATIAGLVERARRAHVPVVWIQHSDADMELGSAEWAIVPELTPAQGEAVVHKRYGDSFEDTTLEEVLAAAGAGLVWVAGAQTDACVRSTLHGALVRGYDTWLVSDAHTTIDLSTWGAPAPEAVIAHTNMYWQFQTAPGRTAGVRESESVDFTAEPSAI